jgi:hypothetical protein
MKRALLNPFLAPALIAAATMAAAPAMAQPLRGPPADPQYQYSTPMPPAVAAPDQIETRLGTLRFDSGVPDQATTDKLYDNLDFQHAVQAYLLGLSSWRTEGHSRAQPAAGATPGRGLRYRVAHRTPVNGRGYCSGSPARWTT